MVLSPLVSPIGPNFIKDWPGQNAINVDNLDNYAGPSLRLQALRTYVPAFTGATTDPTLGTGGIISGYYYCIFDQVYVWGQLRFKTGLTVGSGNYIISLPFAAKTFKAPSTAIGQGPVIGSGQAWDNSLPNSRVPIYVQLRTAQTIMFGNRNNATTRGVSDTGTVPWAIDDGLAWFAKYQRAA